MEKEFKAARKKIRIHLKAAEFENALLVCKELISRDVHSAEIFYYQGLCYYRLQQLPTAVLSYERALSIDANYLDALKGLSLCMLNADDDRAPPQKKLSVLKKLLEVDPEIKNAEPMKKQISLCHWKVAEYDLSFQTLLCLSLDHAREVQRIMFTEVSKTNSALCYKQLHFILAKDKDLMPTSNKMKFYYEYGSFLNEQGEDPKDLINLMVSNLDFYRQNVRVDSSGGSIGSDETGVQVTPNTEEWWPSQTLSAQLWIIWDQISDWNGSPKLQIPEDVSVSLEDTSLILRKDKCTAKTIFHLLQDLDYDKCQDVIDLCTGDMMNNATCSHYNSTCSFHDEICTVHDGNPTVMFLRSVARTTIRKDVEKIPDNLAILEKILQERPTYHNSSLLKLVARFRCYVIHTFNLPNDLVYLKECALQDPIIEAWLALMKNSTTILTCEHPHPMVDAVKQYIKKNTDRHVNIEKLLSVRAAHPKNFTYSTLLLKVLKKEVEEGEYDKSEFEKIVNKCYVNDKKNPTILFYLGDISREQHKDPIAAARYYEKSIRISGSLDVLKLLDSLPQTDDMIKELNIKSHDHILKTSRDHKLHVRLAMLHTNKPNQAIKQLQQALKISPDALTLELLAEKYLSLGKYRSAYKSYSKAAELEPTSYRQYSLAAILSN
ncbi:uncharacterized protein LOC134823512 [Bolinopsis microptera]|uniref:uncharacterized protein LOC134823512 n=1 Tax=Bolinopsis microptera TaxID=2820187 RepID=UPI00307AFC53